MVVPLYFKYKNNTYLKSAPEETYFEQVEKIFGSNYKNETEPSIYNCVYYSIITNKNVFAIRKLKNHKISHRYIVFYDENIFNLDQLNYLLYYIFVLVK